MCGIAAVHDKSVDQDAGGAERCLTAVSRGAGAAVVAMQSTDPGPHLPVPHAGSDPDDVPADLVAGCHRQLDPRKATAPVDQIPMADPTSFYPYKQLALFW